MSRGSTAQIEANNAGWGAGTLTFYERASLGLIDWAKVVHKFGKNETLASASVYEPVTIYGKYPTKQPVGAITVRVKAGGDTADTVLSTTGARKVTVQGLSATGVEQEEEIDLAGASASAATTLAFTRIYRAWVSESGVYVGTGSDSMAAEITIEDSGGAEDWLTIDFDNVGRGQSQIAMYAVPLGWTGFVYEYLLTADGSNTVDFLMFKRGSILDAAPPYQARRTVVEEVGVSNSLPGKFLGGHRFEELTDIGWMARGSVGAAVTVDMEILLIRNHMLP